MTGESKSMLEQEELYDILTNDKGDVLIAIRSRAGEPDRPQIVYDGGEHALLYRNKGLTVALDYIHPDVRETLASASSVTVAELDDDPNADEPQREYAVPVKRTKTLPLRVEQLPVHYAEPPAA